MNRQRIEGLWGDSDIFGNKNAVKLPGGQKNHRTAGILHGPVDPFAKNNFSQNAKEIDAVLAESSPSYRRLRSVEPSKSGEMSSAPRSCGRLEGRPGEYAPGRGSDDLSALLDPKAGSVTSTQQPFFQ